LVVYFRIHGIIKLCYLLSCIIFLVKMQNKGSYGKLRKRGAETLYFSVKEFPFIKILIFKFSCRQPEHNAAIWTYKVFAVFAVSSDIY